MEHRPSFQAMMNDMKKDKKVRIDNATNGIVKRIFAMYLEGKSYYQIAEILKEEKVLYPERKWTDSAIKQIINNQIYVGDYVRNKTDKDNSKRIVYTDVVAPTISRAEWEEVQKQKEKNQQAFCRDRVYIFFQMIVFFLQIWNLSGIRNLKLKNKNLFQNLLNQ